MRSHYKQSGSSTLLAYIVICTIALFGCSNDSIPPDTDLSTLTIEGASDLMYPTFEKGVHHYAVRCNEADTLTLTATTVALQSMVSIDGADFVQSQVMTSIANPDTDKDIVIKVKSGDQDSTYTVHCLATDFPKIQIVRSDPGAGSDLMLIAPKFTQDGVNKAYLIVLDNNGVPRFRRKIDASVNDFKRHANGTYSYAISEERNQFNLRDWAVIILDQDFNEVDRLKTVGLNQTDGHDFILTDEGNYIFVSYHSTIRDMTAYGLTAEEVVGDSVIQEVSADGQVLFQWSSWDHIDLADCQATGFPRFASDYAHLNSISLSPDGDLIASFRGCAQVLKIDRPSGEVLWRLGGSMSDFLIVGDIYNEPCGQHTALEPTTDTILMFDNGGYCFGDREDMFGSFSRVVEYRLDSVAGQAHFVRDYSLNGSYQEFTRSQGSVQLLENGNWFISWGNGPDASISEVDTRGDEVFAVKIIYEDAIAVTYRAFRETSLPDD